MGLHTLPHLTRPTVNDFPPHQDEKVYLCVCACTDPAGTGFGHEYVEQGGETWTKTIRVVFGNDISDGPQTGR